MAGCISILQSHMAGGPSCQASYICCSCSWSTKCGSEVCYHVLLLCCRSSSKDITELHDFVLSVANRINKKYGAGNYLPVVWVERPVSLYEKIALYSVADVAVVTATRDGMNLVPYEYIVCRQGAPVSTLRAPCAQVHVCSIMPKFTGAHLMSGIGRHSRSCMLLVQ